MTQQPLVTFEAHAAEQLAQRSADITQAWFARAEHITERGGDHGAAARVCRSGIHAAEARPSARTLPFGPVLSEVLVEPGDEQHTAGVRVEVEDSVSAIRIDAARVRIVLSNLLRNAIKYSAPARSSRWVRINFNRHTADGLWWTYVSDHGLGIPAEYKDNVFNRHFRAHPERADGTGLGLTIVRQEVQALGGNIECSSEPGVGTTFRFSVPESGAAS